MGFRGGTPRWVLICLVMAGLVIPSPAGAASIGPSLTGTVNTTRTCGNSFPFTPNAATCLAYSVTPTSYAPASGIVSRVRVRTGDAPQGPMQVVVLRSYYQNNLADPGHPNFFCCFVQEYGPTFTPKRNAATTVPVTFGMVEQPTPQAGDGNTVAKGDFLGLSVRASNVPIPVSETSGYTGFYAPGPVPGAPSAPSLNAIGNGQGAFPGFLLMMNADVDGLTLGKGGGRLSGSTASFPLGCGLSKTCRGTLTLRDGLAGRRSIARGPASAAASSPRTLGSAKFTIRAGHKKTVKVRLNSAGRRAAKGHRRITVYATAKIGKAVVTAAVTVKK